MWKKEFSRNFFSIKTIIIILVLISFGIINIVNEFNQKQEIINIYNKHYEDISDEGSIKLINSFDGMKYGTDFLFGPELIEIFILVLFLSIRNICIIAT